uniref:Uncharacterized protein n=1 Tax=viral metagenome TaxID=1070528 RepID=A0A6C0JB64_9ZZZZ
MFIVEIENKKKNIFKYCHRIYFIIFVSEIIF